LESVFRFIPDAGSNPAPSSTIAFNSKIDIERTVAIVRIELDKWKGLVLLIFLIDLNDD
jgi:hypothetical protein